ncbi:MAG: DUF4871 domain-containing protein [Bacillota bacterium]
MMERRKPHWYKELQEPLEKLGFDQENCDRIMDNIRKQTFSSSTRRKRTLVYGVAVVACVLSVTLFVQNGQVGKQWSKLTGSNPSEQRPPEWVNGYVAGTPRNVYMQGEEKKLEAFPGGELAAGLPNGCWWNLYTPFEQLRDKRIRIEATHQESRWKQTEIPETNIGEEAMSYQDFTRISSRFSLPLAGLWKFEVYVDDSLYGDVIFNVKDGSWEKSPLFRSGSYEMRGIEGKLGFIDPGFKAGKGNKYMWHFWGSPEELEGNLSIKAVSQGSDEIIDIFPMIGEGGLGGPNNGADAHLPTSMTLPFPGKWRLLVYIGGQLHGSVIVNVAEGDSENVK